MYKYNRPLKEGDEMGVPMGGMKAENEKEVKEYIMKTHPNREDRITEIMYIKLEKQ